MFDDVIAMMLLLVAGADGGANVGADGTNDVDNVDARATVTGSGSFKSGYVSRKYFHTAS
jgi:hypothetical protein